jgi:molecular chaperone Hsp33
MSHETAPVESSLEVTTWFVRQRNALLARAEFGPLYVDYYLHQADHGLRYASAHDQRLKDTLAALVLHAAGRPWNETIAWTLHLQEPLLNLFACADNSFGHIVGQAFTEDIRETRENLFFSDVVAGHKPRRRSVISFDGSDIFQALEDFYIQSEQRPARMFRLADEDFALLSAQPDCDETWLRSIDLAGIAAVEETEELGFLEKRTYRWECGCSQDRMCEVLAPAMRADAAELFGDEPSLRITCPRCGVRHAITRETLEAYISRHPPS